MVEAPRGGRMLLTGPRGSIGSLLLSSFTRKQLEKTVVVDLAKPRKLARGVVFYKVDVTEPAIDGRIAEILEREEVDTVIHMATLWSPTHRRTYAHEVDVIGTLQLLNACHQRNIQKLIVLSSTAVYGARATNPNYLSESHPLYSGWSNQYIRDKVEMETEIRKFRTRHPRSTVTVLRPCMAIGPNIRNFVTQILASPVIPTILGYDPLVQFLHEEDLLRAIHLGIRKDLHGEFNVVGHGVMPLSYAIKLAGRVNIPLVQFVAKPVLAALWQADLIEVPPHMLDYLRYLWVADGSKLEKEAGFVPKYSSREALESFSGQERLRRVHLAKKHRLRVVNE